MARKRNDNRVLQNIPKIHLILAITVVVFAVLVICKVLPLWLAITSFVLVVLLFLVQLGAMIDKKTKTKDLQ